MQKYFFTILATWVFSSVTDPNPGSYLPGIRHGKIRIRDPVPGSATLVLSSLFWPWVVVAVNCKFFKDCFFILLVHERRVLYCSQCWLPLPLTRLQFEFNTCVVKESVNFPPLSTIPVVNLLPLSFSGAVHLELRIVLWMLEKTKIALIEWKYPGPWYMKKPEVKNLLNLFL